VVDRLASPYRFKNIDGIASPRALFA